MKRILILLFFIALLLAVTTRAAEMRGVWTAERSGEAGVKMNFTVSAGHSNYGHSIPLADFNGLTDAQTLALSETPVHFTLRRDAGSMAFEGLFKAGEGAGHFTFTPNPAYRETLKSLNVDVDDFDSGEDANDRLFSYAALDVSVAYIRSMQAEGYRVSAREYREMRIFNVTPEYVREMRALGYGDLPARKLVETRIHRATPEFIREMAAVGYAKLPVQELVNFRIHRVTPERIREYRTLGYDKLSPSELVSMSIHRVTPEFIKELRAAGYTGVPVQKLISMRIHNIDADMMKKMNVQP